jgi:hypothetical protein
LKNDLERKSWYPAQMNLRLPIAVPLWAVYLTVAACGLAIGLYVGTVALLVA